MGHLRTTRRGTQKAQDQDLHGTSGRPRADRRILPKPKTHLSDIRTEGHAGLAALQYLERHTMTWQCRLHYGCIVNFSELPECSMH